MASKVTGSNDPEPEKVEMKEEDERQALLPVENSQIEEGKNGNKAEENPCAPLNQILHVSSYITYAVGHSRFIFYQNINGLCCLMGRLVAEFAKESVTLICFVTMVCI